MRKVNGKFRSIAASIWPRFISMRASQHRNHLLPPHAREAFEKIINGIARLQVVKEAPHWHPRTHEHGRAPQGFQV